MMNWFQRSGYMTFGFIRKTSQLQILLINAVSLLNLIVNNFNWGWLKGDLQLKKIWELPVLEPDNSDVKDIDWIKTILSQIVVARFVINSVSLVAHVANIYTILTRDRQNLLILWMVLSFVKDILLEIVVVIVTLILWHNGSITTSLLAEFIIKKVIRLAISIWKWCATLNWYMQLRKAATIREFFERVARRSNTSVIDTVRRFRHSLDNMSLGIAIVRRGKYTSLLSLDELFEKSPNRVKFNKEYCDLRISKSLTTLITSENYDANGTNDYDSIVNDLSVAEKSMKMLDITAEDIMDARARIQERSYWNRRDATAKISNPVEKMMTYFSLEKDGEETEYAFRDKQIVIDDKENNKIGTEEENIDVTEDVALGEENATAYFLMKKETAKQKMDNSETVLRDKRKDIFTEKRKEAVSHLLQSENGNITSDKVKDHVTPMTLHDFYTISREKKEEAQKITKTIQCSLSQHERNMNVKVCPSLVKDMEAKFCFIPVSCEHKWISKSDQRRHTYRVETKQASLTINVDRKEHSTNSKMSLPTCHCASSMNIHTHKNKENAQSTNTKNKNVNHDTDNKKLKCSISNVVAQEDRPNGDRFALKHLERRLKKRTQTYHECLEKQPVTWDSMSLAQTARPSGYDKKFVTFNKPFARQTDLKSIQTETFNESKGSLSRQHKLKHVQQARHTQSLNLRLANDFESFKKKNYMKFQEREMMEARTFNFILLEDEKQIRGRNRYNLSPSRKLSAEEREAIESRALKICNKQTLLDNKNELEARKKYGSSLNYERSLKEAEISKTKDSKTCNDVILFGNREETRAITGNDLPTNYKRSVEKLEALAAYSKFTSSNYNLIAGRKHDSSKHAASSIYEEDIDIPTRASNLLKVDNVPDDRLSEASAMSHLLKIRDNVSNGFDLSDRNARRTCVSLNLREITRNIEWTLQPGGITLINKNLQGELPENGRFRESQQRDIVDNNTTSMLHNAFFFKPEIIMRIFRRAQTRFQGSFSNFEIWRRTDFNVEFVCRVNNEMNVQNRDLLFDFDFEWIMGSRSDLSRSLLFNINSNRIAEEENNPDLCIIFIGRDEFPSESESAIVEDSESQRSARLSIENVQATNILIFDANHRQTDNATTDNLSLQLIISVLRNFGIEMSEEDTRNISIEQIEEFGNISNVTVINDFPSCTFNTSDMNNDKGNNMYDKISLSQNIYYNNMVDDENKQILYLSNSSSDNPDVSSVKSLEHVSYYEEQDEKYLSAIDINIEDKISENNSSFINVDNDITSRLSNLGNNNDKDDNRQFGMSKNRTEENISNVSFERSMKIFSPKMSFVESYSSQTSILKSADKELQKVPQLANGQAISENKRARSILNSEIKNSDTTLQSHNVEALKLIDETQNSIRSEDEGRTVYGKINGFLAGQFSGMYSSDESDINSLYEKNNNRSELTSHESSLMEEFLNDTAENIFTSAYNSAHPSNNGN
ncbi:uncharacterized protein LOC116850490 [Odontomachus brunneus]|uniref:uncharacterized protein LOC116850490 n=1 Tax=Odontomachus brunneus TaxID=486640 RepID=UPI0013F22C4B|nr:uncharacterized protein LOC116850490 [Odontomachus brunneus]